ncbi:conserved hypothetical protein [Desulfosarcina cetonica]|uniref:response regulator n=1 Tax=Desulfosarcina cetonica TaxID=90730 RepID=UPI0006D0141C|nr:response regulator [Desulfosarcina cetonica]VTR71367.1 conserved hypothetical protein [Desulfosarcina cetonica]
MSDQSEQNLGIVLLAEDDAEMRILLSLALKKNQCKVIECKNGVELLSKIEPILNGEKDVGYDLIITDIRMPGITGMEVLEGIAGLPGCPPMILITAFGDPQTHEKGRQFGAAAVLDKPFELAELTGIVHTLLARRQH